MKTRRGFTIVELSVGIVVMMITYAAISLSASGAKQTAKHEAERLAAYIFRTIQKADRIHQGFNMDMKSEVKADGTKEYYVMIRWPNVGLNENEDKDFKASAGCTYKDNFQGKDNEITYNATDKKFTNGGADTGGTITVTDSQGEKYYVIIAVTEGRIRLDENPPD